MKNAHSQKNFALCLAAVLLAGACAALSLLPAREAGNETAYDEEIFPWLEDLPAPASDLEGLEECESFNAASPDSPVSYSPGLETADHRPYMHGSGGLFRPEEELSRAEAAQIIYSLLEYEPLLTGSASFTDVAEDDWYAAPVLSLAEMGAVSGYEDGSFQPDSPISRRDLVMALGWFSEGLEEGTALPAFPDVPEDDPGYAAICAAVAKGWIAGYGDGRFYPGQPVTRAEAASIINKALGRVPDSGFLEANGYVLLFPDLPFTHWAYADIMEAALGHTHTADGQAWASCAEPVAEGLSPGNYLFGGELYRLTGNQHWLRNKTSGTLTFGSDGRYTSGDEALDQALTAFVREHLEDGPVSLDDFRSLYEILITFPYRPGSYLTDGYDDGQTGWEPEMALEMLEEGKGNCYRYAGLGTMLARKLGFQAEGIAGYVDIGDEFILHGWFEVYTGGQSYLCDPQQQYRFPDEDLFMKEYGGLEGRTYQAGGVLKE